MMIVMLIQDRRVWIGLAEFSNHYVRIARNKVKIGAVIGTDRKFEEIKLSLFSKNSNQKLGYHTN